jgi:hypothetical protein
LQNLPFQFSTTESLKPTKRKRRNVSIVSLKNKNKDFKITFKISSNEQPTKERKSKC